MTAVGTAVARVVYGYGCIKPAMAGGNADRSRRAHPRVFYRLTTPPMRPAADPIVGATADGVYHAPLAAETAARNPNAGPLPPPPKSVLRA